MVVLWPTAPPEAQGQQCTTGCHMLHESHRYHCKYGGYLGSITVCHCHGTDAVRPDQFVAQTERSQTRSCQHAALKSGLFVCVDHVAERSLISMPSERTR
jgi:hypothetical protein